MTEPKTVFIDREKIALTPEMTAGDLKGRVGASPEEHLSSWYQGRLWYWDDGQCPFEHVHHGEELWFRILEDHPQFVRGEQVG